MADDQTRLLENQTSYSTRELKLASLLLGEIQGSTVQVYSDGNNSPKKIIKIIGIVHPYDNPDGKIPLGASAGKYFTVPSSFSAINEPTTVTGFETSNQVDEPLHFTCICRGSGVI